MLYKKFMYFLHSMPSDFLWYSNGFASLIVFALIVYGCQ